MNLQLLKLTNFKSYEKNTFRFHPKLNILHGRNGCGKTNLLDAIYTLSMTKSYFQAADSRLRKQGHDFYRLEGHLDKAGASNTLVIKSVKGKKKTIECNGSTHNRLADHLGFMPVVMVAPDDMLMVDGDNADRRRFLNRTLSQVSRTYLDALIEYKHLLKQRNSILRQGRVQGKQPSDMLLFSFSERMADSVNTLWQQRANFFEAFSPQVSEHHMVLSEAREQVKCVYQPDGSANDFLQRSRENLARDAAMGRTLIGPHCDRIQLEIDGEPAKQFGSQGQRKSLVLALKLAEFQHIARATGLRPLLLLDDIFDRLDSMRVRELLNLVQGSSYGQVFISDTSLHLLADMVEGQSYGTFAIDLNMQADEEE